MKFEFLVAAPELPLYAKTSEISAKILAERQHPERMELNEANYRAFESRIESAWGEIYPNLPGFVASVLEGRWTARPGTTAPSDLIGDFGEFFAAEVFRGRCTVQGHVARVLRPGNMKRPDFLVHDQESGILTALEVKTRSTNASTWLEDLRNRLPEKQLHVNCCKLVRISRDKGLRQIDHELVHKTLGPLPGPRGSAVRFESLIPAHQRAIVVPLFPDGRMDRLPKERLKAPLACRPLPCSVCLTEQGESLVLAPIFLDGVSSPAAPEVPPGGSFFDAYATASRGFWLRSPTMFRSGLAQVRGLMAEQEGFQAAPEIYLQPLLDMLAAAMEAGIVPNTDPRDALWEVASFSIRGPEEIIAGAVELHEQDRTEAAQEEAVALISDEATELDGAEEDLPTQRRPPHVDTLGSSLSGKQLIEAWTRRWSSIGERRPRVVPRHLSKSVQLQTLSAAQWRDLLEEHPEQEQILTLGEPGSQVEIVRPSFRPGATIRLRFGGPDDLQVRDAVLDFVTLSEDSQQRNASFGSARERIRGNLHADEVRLGQRGASRAYHARLAAEPQPGQMFDLVLDTEGTGTAAYVTRPRRVG